MKDIHQYPVRAFWSDEDEGYIALAPDLPGCSAFGDSREEAFLELDLAMEAWIEAAQNAGNPVPPPSKSKIGAETPSGRILLRLPRTLHAELTFGAEREGTSLNQHIVFLLTSASAFRSFSSAVASYVSDVRSLHIKVVGYSQLSTHFPEVFSVEPLGRQLDLTSERLLDLGRIAAPQLASL